MRSAPTDYDPLPPKPQFCSPAGQTLSFHLGSHAKGSKSDRKSEEQYDFTHVWDTTLKATNEQTNTHGHRQQDGGHQRERGVRGMKGKGGQVYGDRKRLDVGGEHTVQCTDDVL